MSKVCIVRKPLGIPMPALKTGWINRKVQGGAVPVAFRSRTASWALANKWAKSPEFGVWLD